MKLSCPFGRVQNYLIVCEHTTYFAIILVHNHPSGDPAPSGYDRDVTARVARAGQMMQVQLLDHIIIGDREYYSFRDDSSPELDGISKI